MLILGSAASDVIFMQIYHLKTLVYLQLRWFERVVGIWKQA